MFARRLTLALLIGAPLAAQTRPTLSPLTRQFVRTDAPVIALTHVKLIDGTGTPPRTDQTIVLRNGRIEAVGPAASLTIPAGAEVLDLTGHTVTPGFVGMHEHTYFRQTSRTTQMSVTGPRLYLAYGVTTIRTAGSMFPYNELNLKHAIERGEVPGPRMHITGPYLNGEAGPNGLNRGLRTPDEARRVVAYWAEEGATWLKFQGNVTREVLGAAIAEAHRRGMKVTGHLCSVSFREAAALGIDNLEHGLITNSDYVPDKRPDVCPPENMRVQVNVDLDGEDVKATFRDLIAKKVAITSTLSVYELFVPGRAKLMPKALELLAPDTRAEVEAEHASYVAPNAAFNVPPELFRKMMRYDLMFHRAGGLLVAGVDPWGHGSLPGLGDLRNYEVLVEVGFRPEEAIKVMSANGAALLGAAERFGTVAPGKVADLVVFRGDPAVTPSDIYNVVLASKDGVLYDSAKLIESAKGLVGLR
jgi:imidazolonepropionase-like amidohydrolase